MNFQYATERSRKIGRQKLADKCDEFILALLLDKGELEKSEPAKQSFLARATALPQAFGKTLSMTRCDTKISLIASGKSFAACCHQSRDWNVRVSATDLHPGPRHNN